MPRLIEGKLLSGFIYGDRRNKEYIYLPGSEMGATPPVLVYEIEGSRQDVSLVEALHLIEKRSLKLTSHPMFGERTV